jgi:hypothetical protein
VNVIRKAKSQVFLRLSTVLVTAHMRESPRAVRISSFYERDIFLIKGHEGNTVRKERGGAGGEGSLLNPNHTKGWEWRGGQGGEEGNKISRYRNTRRLRTTTEAIARGANIPHKTVFFWRHKNSVDQLC